MWRMCLTRKKEQETAEGNGDAMFMVPRVLAASNSRRQHSLSMSHSLPRGTPFAQPFQHMPSGLGPERASGDTMSSESDDYHDFLEVRGGPGHEGASTAVWQQHVHR